MASRIAEILLRASLIDDLQLRSAMAHQAQWGGRLPHIVVDKRFTTEAKVVDAIADGMRLPKVDLDTIEMDPAALTKVSEDSARAHAVFPCALKDNGKTLWLAMADPTNLPVIDELERKGRVRIKIVVSSERQILAAIKRGYHADEASQNEDSRSAAYGSIASMDVGSEEEEGKIVDMSGHTLIKNIKDIEAQAKAKAAAPPAGTPAAPAKKSMASAMLDDLFGDGEAPPAQWTAKDLERLHAIQDQQEKGARILRAVLDLCAAKGVFQPEEYRQKLKKN